MTFVPKCNCSSLAEPSLEHAFDCPARPFRFRDAHPLEKTLQDELANRPIASSAFVPKQIQGDLALANLRMMEIKPVTVMTVKELRNHLFKMEETALVYVQRPARDGEEIVLPKGEALPLYCAVLVFPSIDDRQDGAKPHVILVPTTSE